MAIADIKHSPTPSQINIKPHSEAYLSQFLLPNTSCLAFNQKLQGMLEVKEKESEERKQTSEPDSDMTQILGL